MSELIPSLLAAAQARALALAGEVEALRAKEAEAIADCRAKGLAPGGDFWLRRHHAERQLRTATFLLEVFAEAVEIPPRPYP